MHVMPPPLPHLGLKGALPASGGGGSRASLVGKDVFELDFEMYLIKT